MSGDEEHDGDANEAAETAGEVAEGAGELVETITATVEGDPARAVQSGVGAAGSAADRATFAPRCTVSGSASAPPGRRRSLREACCCPSAWTMPSASCRARRIPVSRLSRRLRSVPVLLVLLGSVIG